MIVVLYLFTACMLIQVVFFILMIKVFGSYRMPAGDSTTPVSVVVCARNEAANLRRLLPQLVTQEHCHFEVVLVDDRSSDETAEICKDFMSDAFRYLRIEELASDINGKKNAIAAGINAASHEIILLTDADCIPSSPNWITLMCGGFEPQKEIVLGFSMYEKERGLLNLLIRFETVWTAIHYIGLALSGLPYMGVGRNLAYKKGLFQRNSGFNGIAHLTGGDDDLLVNRYGSVANCAVVIGKMATTWSVPKRTWSEFFIQKVRHMSVGRYYSPASRLVLGVLSLSHIFGYIFMGILLTHPVYWVYAVSGLVIRTLLLLYTFKKACQKLEMPFSTGKILPMDLLYAIYYPVMGISASFRKKIRWN